MLLKNGLAYLLNKFKSAIYFKFQVITSVLLNTRFFHVAFIAKLPAIAYNNRWTL